MIARVWLRTRRRTNRLGEADGVTQGTAEFSLSRHMECDGRNGHATPTRRSFTMFKVMTATMLAALLTGTVLVAAVIQTAEANSHAVSTGIENVGQR